MDEHASYFWAAAAVTGGTFVTESVYPSARGQWDIHFPDILERMAALLKENQTGCLFTAEHFPA
ncbi:MAG: hypothetical protein JSV50_14025 [Desulfobacteraceae bacterium]|nr:MAG: hypothetical protein JSV50_14025 [Desulfobacteraceae bacterium]